MDELSRRQADALLVQHGFRRTGEWTERSRLHSVAEVTRPPEPLDGEVALLLTPGGRGVLARVDRMHAQGWAYHSFRPSAGDGWDRGGVIGNVPVATWDRDGITVVPGVEHPDWLRTYLG